MNTGHPDIHTGNNVLKLVLPLDGFGGKELQVNSLWRHEICRWHIHG